jgi:hypothetical protein
MHGYEPPAFSKKAQPFKVGSEKAGNWERTNGRSSFIMANFSFRLWQGFVC